MGGALASNVNNVGDFIMKKLLSAAAIAASLASTGAYAACSADIDMGGNKITSASMTALGTSSEVATKAYVDNLIAGSNPVLELSAEASVTNFGGALKRCVDLAGDSPDRPWRLPTLAELLVAASSHTDGSASSNFLWTATPYNLSTGATQDLDTDGQGQNVATWVVLELGGGYWSMAGSTNAAHFARCVR